jgi:glyoxylate reductase
MRARGYAAFAPMGRNVSADTGSPLLFVGSKLPDEVNRDLASNFSVTFSSGADPSSAMMRAGLPYEALLVSVDVRLDADVISRLPRSVRAIATYSVGLDHIDLQAAGERGLAVFNTPDVLSDAVAETALLLLLGAARRATESIALIRSRRWTGWTATQLVGVQLTGRVLGIFGMGKIGRKIASRARSFGMRISYSNRRPIEENLAEGARFYPQLSRMLAEVDALVLAAPSSPETRGIVDRTLLAHAKPGLMIINVARGDLVNDDDLIDALVNGTVRSAGLDVFAGEPAVNPRYFDLPNLFMLPHIGSSTEEARRAMGMSLITGLRDWREGKLPANRVL